MRHKIFIFTATISVFLISACTTTKSAGTTADPVDSETGATELLDPKLPQILDMGFSDIMGESSTAVKKISAGKSAVIYLRLKDSEWDLAGLTITAEKTGKKSDPISIEFDYQYEEEFVFAEKLDVPDEKGKWTFTAIAYDHRGNKSRAFSTTVTVE